MELCTCISGAMYMYIAPLMAFILHVQYSIITCNIFHFVLTSAVNKSIATTEHWYNSVHVHIL